MLMTKCPESVSTTALGQPQTLEFWDPTVTRWSTSGVPIGGSRLFRLRVIGEEEKRESAVTGLDGKADQIKQTN